MRIDVPISGFIINKNGQIVIPKIVRDAMELKIGDKVEWSNMDIKKGEMTCQIRKITGKQKLLPTD